MIALQAMRGVKLVTAATIVSELGDIGRFRSLRELMAHAGMVPSEQSSGGAFPAGETTANAKIRSNLWSTTGLLS
jgi:transposase